MKTKFSRLTLSLVIAGVFALAKNISNLFVYKL